jgi:hypothetical protein
LIEVVPGAFEPEMTFIEGLVTDACGLKQSPTSS